MTSMVSLASYFPRRSPYARAFWIADGTANPESGECQGLKGENWE